MAPVACNTEDAFGTVGGRISVTQSLENESEKSVTHSVLGTVLLSRPTGGSSSSSNGTPSGGGMSTADLAYFGLQRNPENAIDAPKGAVPTSSKVFPRFKCLNNKLIGRPRRVLVEKTDESSVSDDSGEMEKQQNSGGAAGCSRSEQENLLPSTSQGPSNTDSLKENQVACFPGPPKTTMVSGSIMKLKEGLPSLKIQGTQCSFALGYSVPHPCSQLPRAMQKLCEISESLESQSEKVNIPPCSQLPRAMQKLCEISESLESQSEKVNIPPINELAKSLSGMAKTNNSYQKVKSTAKSAYGELSLTKEVEGRVVNYVAKSLVEDKSVDTEKSQPRSALELSLSNSFPMAVKDQSCSSSQQAEHSIGSAVPSSAAIVYPAQMTAITSSSSTTGGSIISSEKQVALHDGQARVNISEGSRSSYSTAQHQAPKLNKDEVTIPLEQPKKVPSLLALSSTGDKAASRGREGGSRKAGESDHFVWVNNRRYQKLGKIGCGGSSDVYKVISQDCTIFALKRIKLKGRDHQTASGFYQEIEYLQRLHGQRHIIKLVDFEVSDKKIFEDINAQHGEFIVEDAFIYMVLEYGEIDLACMLDQKKKEMSERKQRLDENWLRLYLEHILEAVNTIHEVRIVHADLKPANFLLVNGVLKLIDFGIAKAIQNDTTNIVRESQVGTLNYMSPEAFMMNTCDERGSVVKCGRASDIWSLGCILYQMVYGRTPFSHLNLYAKIKEITNPKHEIQYPSVSNSAVVDFMQKCLVWDKNKRLRIPQLLEHPFLRPLSICYSLPYTTSHGPESLQELVQSCCDYVSVAGASQFRILMQKVIMGDFESVHEEDYLRSVLVQSLKHWISENGPLGLQEIVKTVASSVEKKYNSAS